MKVILSPLVRSREKSSRNSSTNSPQIISPIIHSVIQRTDERNRVAMKIFADFGGMLFKEFIICYTVSIFSVGVKNWFLSSNQTSTEIIKTELDNSNIEF